MKEIMGIKDWQREQFGHEICGVLKELGLNRFKRRNNRGK